jgi:hypothetical protein
MLERCVRLDAAYIPAYLLLARLYQGQEGRGPAVGRLLRHVAHLQPNSPDHLAELAAWLHQQGEGNSLHICIAFMFLPHNLPDVQFAFKLPCYSCCD